MIPIVVIGGTVLKQPFFVHASPRNHLTTINDEISAITPRQLPNNNCHNNENLEMRRKLLRKPPSEKNN